MTLKAQKMRDEITEQYRTNQHGQIIDLGKFEREMIYVPFYWAAGLNGCASKDLGNVYFCEVCEDERAAFPELGNAYAIGLEESDAGFVYSTVYATSEAYTQAVERIERDLETEETEE